MENKEEENVKKDILEEILRSEKENKESMISLSILLTKNKNNTNILLNKLDKLSSDVEKINNHIKWRRIWIIIYWVFILGSIFGTWYFLKNSIGDILDFITGIVPDSVNVEEILKNIKEKLKI